MQDYAFDIVRVRGLGKSPTPPPPPPLVQDQGSVAGVGQDPASVREPEGVGLEPEGVGQGQPALPPGIQIVGPQTQCKHWILAFVVGAKMANVLLHDGAGFDHQLVANLLAPGQKPVFFTFAGTEGTYLFAYETVNGRHVIKMCVDGMTLHHTPQSRVPWTVSKHPAAKMTGLGAVFKTAPAYIGSGVTSGGNVQIDPINRSVGGKWATLGTIDSSGNFNASDPTGQLTKASDLQSTLNNWASNIQQVGGTAPKVGGFFYFGLSDTNSGAAQTPGEPPGMAIMRYNGSRLDMLISETGGVAAIASSPTWVPAAYAYLAGGTVHTPPVGVPYGVQPTAGAWVWRPSMNIPGVGIVSVWMWYPTANVPSFLPTPVPPLSAGSAGGAAAAMIAPTAPPTSGPTGIWVYANASAAPATGPNPLPPPVSPPVAGAVGQWVSKHNGYYVWIGTGASSAVAPATTSSTGLILLGVLGVLAVGGVGYYLLS